MTETGTRTSRAPDLTGTGALALLAALAVSWAARRSGVLPGALLGGAQPYLVGRPVQAAVVVVVALVLVLGLPTHARTRLWALVLSVPITLGPVAVRPAAAGPLIRVR
jgi:hypothetical protein